MKLRQKIAGIVLAAVTASAAFTAGAEGISAAPAELTSVGSDDVVEMELCAEQYDASKLAAPKNVTAKTTSSSITLSWNKVKGADAYRVYSYDESTKKYVKYKDVTAANCKITKLPSGKTYKFKVAALVKNSKGKYTSQTQSKTVSAKTKTSSSSSAKLPSRNVTNRIKWMSWYTMDETSAEAELFKKTYGIPVKGDDPGSGGMIFENTFIAYGERFEKLSASIAADNSPDMVAFETVDFPYGVVAGRYQPIDDIVNLKSANWNPVKSAMDSYALDGKHYAAFGELYVNNLLFYRKSVIKEAGLSDPKKLFDQGEWDWDAFLKMARKFSDPDNNKYVIDGYNPADSFIASTGTPMIGLEKGQLVSNLDSAEVERAENLITVLQNDNLRYPRHELSSWAANPRSFADGNTLFYADGSWFWEITLAKYTRLYGWADDEIGVVPFPKDPDAKSYYTLMSPDGYMWVKGSKNSTGVGAWLDCVAAVAATNDHKDDVKTGVDKDNWNKSDLEFIYSLTALDGTSPVTPVFEFKTGLGSTVYDSYYPDSPVMSLTDTVYLTGGQSYADLREMHEPAIQSAIDYINKGEVPKRVV